MQRPKVSMYNISLGDYMYFVCMCGIHVLLYKWMHIPGVIYACYGHGCQIHVGIFISYHRRGGMFLLNRRNFSFFLIPDNFPNSECW